MIDKELNPYNLSQEELKSNSIYWIKNYDKCKCSLCLKKYKLSLKVLERLLDEQ